MLILSGNQYTLMRVLMAYDKSGKRAVAMEEIAIMAGLCRRSVLTHLTALEANKLIAAERRQGCKFRFKILDAGHQALRTFDDAIRIS